MNKIASGWVLFFAVAPSVVMPSSVESAERTCPIALPSGVAEPSHDRAYLASADGGIDCVDLKDGKVLWSVKERVRPVIAVKDGMLALVSDKPGSFQVVLFDKKDKGKESSRSSPVEIPTWVQLQPKQGLSFSVKANLKDKSLSLWWEATAWYAGGPPPSEEILQSAKKSAFGAVRVNLENGNVEPLKDGPPKASLPEKLKDIRSRPYLIGERDSSDPIVLADQVAVLDTQKTEGGEKLSLLRWDLSSGEQLAPSELGMQVVVRLTLDKRHLLVRSKANKSGTGTIFSIDSGKVVGKQDIPIGSELSVLGECAYSVVLGEERRHSVLRATDLKTTKTLWERLLPGAPPLRQASYGAHSG